MLVDNRDALRLQPFDRRGDEVAHGANLAGVEIAAQLQHDRGAGRLAVALEEPALGNDEMHAGRLHPTDGAHRARELAFEGAQVVDALHEARRGEGVALVEDLVADAATGRQALAGELHAELRQVGAGREDRLAVGPGLVADAAGVEVAGDGGRVLHGQVRVEHAERRLRHPHDDKGEEADEGQRHHAMAPSRAGPSRVRRSNAPFTAGKPA